MRIFRNAISLTIIIAVIACCSVCSFGQADTPDPVAYQDKIIDSIETAGNAYVSDDRIFSVARSKPGQLFSVSVAQEDVKRIAAVAGVKFAYYSIEPVADKIKLIFVIKEQNVIRSITFSGEKKYSDKKLIEELGFSRGDYFDKFTAQGGADALTAFYHKRGYAFIEVSYDDSEIDQGKLRYIITQGPRVKIKKITFEGDSAIKAKELKKVIKSKPKKFGVLQNYFKESVLADDLIKLSKAYDKRGYLDTQVTADTEFGKDNKTVRIAYRIVEGSQYDIEKIELIGNTFYSDANISETFRLAEGEFYSDEKAEYDTDEILNAYRKVGFVNVKVEQTRQFTASNKILARFKISEGDRFKIGYVNISGNKLVQDKVIRRVLDEEGFKPGQWYNAYGASGDGEGELETRVKSSVYAKTATITPTGEDPNSRDAEVRITEGKTGSVLFGAGVSSTDGLIGQVVYEQRNFDYKKWPKSWRKFFTGDAFKGAGQRLRIAAEPGTEVSRYSISFTEPYLKDKPISMNISGSNWARERDSFDEERMKGYLGFNKRMKHGRYRTLAFRFENVSIEDIEAGSAKEITDVSGDNIIAGIKIGFGRDMTDNRLNPTKGKSYELSYEQVGGDHVFGVVEGTYRIYKTLHEDIARRKTILATKFYAGAIVGDAPLFEKFYAGGSGSVRGFDYYGISKRSGANNDPVGSEWIGTVSSEVVVPLTNEALSGLLFIDSAIIDTGGIRVSAGIGVQILIPQWFGPVPMRFELATPLMKDGDDDTKMFSFSVGTLF